MLGKSNKKSLTKREKVSLAILSELVQKINRVSNNPEDYNNHIRADVEIAFKYTDEFLARSESAK